MANPPTRALSPDVDSRIDWAVAARTARRVIARRLYLKDGDVLEDLTQTAIRRLILANRALDEVENQEALTYQIARHTVTDWIRRQRFERLFVSPSTPDSETALWDTVAAPGHEGSGNELERFRFMTLEYFRQGEDASAPGRGRPSSSPHVTCLTLARHYFRERDWSTVAMETGISHAAVRKQWSRCCTRLREHLIGLGVLREDFLGPDSHD